MNKITTLVTLASLSLAATFARAATETEIVRLPDFIVQSARIDATAEKAMQRDIEELRQAARHPMPVEVQLPSLSVKIAAQPAAAANQPAPKAVVAKL